MIAHQIILGLGLIVVATIVQGCSIGSAMVARQAVARAISRLTLLNAAALMAGAALWMLMAQLAGIALWAVAMQWLGAFEASEPAIYFALSAYTTLGFGDVLPPREWRIMGAMLGANGMLGFGLATAALIEFVLGIQRLHAQKSP